MSLIKSVYLLLNMFKNSSFFKTNNKNMSKLRCLHVMQKFVKLTTLKQANF